VRVRLDARTVALAFHGERHLRRTLYKPITPQK
jgi:hypothetical protein